MDKLALLELLLAGFFTVVCIRARAPQSSNQEASFGSLFRLSNRLERLRRTRWQWFSMVAIMLALRVQHELPPAVEIMVASLFLLFVAFPIRALVRVGR
jgi:hypothetical protein